MDRVDECRVVTVVVLDNHALTLLLDRHRGDPARRTVLAHLEADEATAVSPSIVFVEAAIDRRSPEAAPVNRLVTSPRPRHETGRTVDDATRARTAAGRGSVVDAMVASVAATTQAAEVLTSDVGDLRVLLEHLDADTRVVHLA